MSENKLRNQIALMPDAPGVYLMKDDAGVVLYIGKAKSLKKRLTTYVGRDLSSKTVVLMSNVADIEYMLTPNESTALILEASLVRKYKPKYNVSLRDDKSFPLVKITNEEFPAIYITRKREADGAIYLGPYTNVKLLRQALKIIRRSFPFRSCKTLLKKACIYYRLKLSPAPCIGKISRKDYADTITNIRLILEGRAEALIKKLSEEMAQRSKDLRFEEAAKLRDRISALSALRSSQGVFDLRGELEGLKNLLKLEKLPERIEAFDISDIFGKEASGSMVSFYKGLPDKNNYRRFRIKTVSRIDDYKMLAEVVRRRYSRVIAEKLPLPDLVLIDGGRPHLMVADRQIKQLGIELALVSIAKPRKRDAVSFLRGKAKENIYTKDKRAPIRFSSDTPALNLIRRIRDEAHRFALKYHHVLHRKKIIGR